MFEVTIHALTLIGYMFVLFFLFCLCCLMVFFMIIAWDFRKSSQKSKYAKHQTAGEITDKDAPNARTFLASLDEIEARQKRLNELAALRDAANRGEYPVDPKFAGWEHYDKNYAKDQPTEIYPFNTIGKGVEDVLHPRFKDR